MLDLWTARWRKGAPPPFSAPVFDNTDDRSVTWTGEELVVAGPACARSTGDDEVDVCTSGEGAVEVAACRPERDRWRVLRAPQREGLRASWTERGTMVRRYSAGWTGREVVYDPYPSAAPWERPRRLLLFDPAGQGSWRWTDPFPGLGLGSDEHFGRPAMCVVEGQVVAATTSNAGTSEPEPPPEVLAARLDARGRWEVFARCSPQVPEGTDVPTNELYCPTGGSPLLGSVARSRPFEADPVVWVLDVAAGGVSGGEPTDPVILFDLDRWLAAHGITLN